MSVRHETKVNHYFSPSEAHLTDFLSSVSNLYEENVFTDLKIIAADGVFTCHQIVLASCSSYIKNLIVSQGYVLCPCESLTIHLPDFNAVTLKNLLSILYTGKSLGNCSTDDVKSLISFLKIDIGRLEPSPLNVGSSNGGDPPPRLPSLRQTLSSSSPSQCCSDSGPNGRGSSSPMDGTAPPPPHSTFTASDSSPTRGEDEVLEVTPSIQSFMGNHFLAGEEELAAGAVGDGVEEDNISDEKDSSERYSCRLCGKSASNGASLFAHLLYPHYAHLWKDEVPHRAHRYECKHCTYVTTKRQHFIMHIARVHDELKNKLSVLGENLGVLDNLSKTTPPGIPPPPSSSPRNERIQSSIAKSGNEYDALLQNNNNNIVAILNNTQDEPPPDEPKPQLQPPPSSILKLMNSEDIGGGGGVLGSGCVGMSLMGEESPAEKLASSLLQFHHHAQQQQLNHHVQQQQQSFLANSPSSLLPAPTRLPRGYKPFVKCRLCGKAWKGKDNFFTHLVSTHFKYLWANEVPRHAEMFHCKVQDCNYQSKYRYNFLFHLAGKHKQLKQKLADEGVPLEVLTPLETDGSEFETPLDSPESIRNKLLNSALNSSSSSPSSSSCFSNGAIPTESNTKLVCRVCSKVSLNHTCHRQHVVGKHFQHFWAHHVADSMGIFNCPHHDCPYKTPNRSVFVIHLAYVHQELKLKIAESGQDPTIILPDVFGKRKYRRSSFGFGGPSLPALTRAPMNLTMAAMVEAANAVRLAAAVSAAQSATANRSEAEITTSSMERNNNNTSNNNNSIGSDHSPPPPIIPTSSTPSSSKNRLIGYKCVLCRAEFSRSRNVIEHLSLSHFLELWESGPLALQSSSSSYSCKDCDFETGSKTTYVSHLTTAHDGLKYLLDMRDMKIGVMYESVFGSEEEEEHLEEDEMMISGDIEEPIDEEMDDEEEFEEDVDSILSFN
ncbi:uncharacterized protein [Lepeophtheirus salmonis]|uniref:uncharacterized protein n=1 Tax=Lepeophtheirus salmonis TaxID=72036 RepID=UPI001AE8C53F|nr:uncharacterized protein LOC121130242 [Lepeophtheirus salmonis]